MILRDGRVVEMQDTANGKRLVSVGGFSFTCETDDQAIDDIVRLLAEALRWWTVTRNLRLPVDRVVEDSPL